MAKNADWREQADHSPRFWHAHALDAYPRLRHVFTPAGFNVSLRSGPDRAGSPHRRAQLCRLLGAEPASLQAGDQVHGRVIRLVGAPDPGTGPTVHPDTDGLITNEVGVPLLAQSADCPLILLYSPTQHVLGLAHSGWRGTLGGMPHRLVEALAGSYGAAPQDLVAVVPPSAGACCYEIREDVYDALTAFCPDPGRHIRRQDERMYLDLWSLIAAQLVEAGLPENAVHLPSQCTICDERFFSYRRQGPGNGHAALVACLR